MGKKNKNQDDVQVAAVEKRSGPDGGILFEASDSVLESTIQKTGLHHVNKPWSRHAWERATPWVLSQRQKLEGNGWTGGDAIRTELFVLKRPAPNGTYTEDGYIYMRVPKKMIDFFRTARKNNTDEAGNEKPDDETHAGKKKRSISSRISKKREERCNYDLSDPKVWNIKIDNANSEEPGKDPTVMIDVPEALENIFYLIMCLQPGLLRLYAWRDGVIQAGTHEVDVREDAEPPTARHRALVAGHETYERVLPPAYWFKRNRDDLEKILGEGFEASLQAAEEVERSTTRVIKDVEEKIWEELVKVDEKSALAKKNKKKSLKGAKSKAAASEDASLEVAAAA